ncbi:MAG: glucose-6-phosphate dehydrogenase assembly protein OpcA [Verrucomicrobiota bacterium]
MPATSETFTAGLPVEIGEIDRELKKLWTESGGAMTRASLINLAIYSETPESLPKNTQLISRITENHACRAIVIGANSAAKENRVEAWISAHCHVSRAGSKQVCSEQLSFLLEGRSVNLLPNIVFSQLDSDLPFYLWWQDEFPDPMDPQLWAWVDRLIYDSQTWRDFQTQLRLVQTAQAEARQRIVLCDLNWTRLVHHRLALAQFFDHPASHHHLDGMKRARIEHAPEYRSAAILLAGWLAAQLGYDEGTADKSGMLRFKRTEDAAKIFEVELIETVGEPISRCVVTSASLEFRVAHASGSDLLEVSSGTVGKERMHQLLPAGKNDSVSLMSEELMRGGPHRVYLRAVDRVRELI